MYCCCCWARVFVRKYVWYCVLRGNLAHAMRTVNTHLSSCFSSLSTFPAFDFLSIAILPHNTMWPLLLWPIMYVQHIDKIDRIYEWLSCSSMLFSQINEWKLLDCVWKALSKLISFAFVSVPAHNANNYEHSTDIIGAVWIGFFRVFRHFSLSFSLDSLILSGRFLSCSQYIRISQNLIATFQTFLHLYEFSAVTTCHSICINYIS